MSNELKNTELPVPAIAPALDSGFRPAVLARREFQKAAQQFPSPVLLALERNEGSITRFDTVVADGQSPATASNFFQLERLVKFLLWSRGGWKLWFSGPAELGEQLTRHYQSTPSGRFDADLMGRIYEHPFEVAVVRPEDIPPARENSAPLGRHLRGCRIGFDVGASDRKVAAVMDGKVVFSEETVWDPRPQADPQWHFNQIMDSLQRAAVHLPRVDAIGGSSAGVIVNNRIMVASLFRGVPEALFQSRVKMLFPELKAAWQSIPFEVVNDGEVTALAGAMALNENGVLGIAMGSSEAAGYVTSEGRITQWLNELAFAPVDYNPRAAIDEWSGDFGCGVQYFSQQAVGRLIPQAGLEISPKLPLPERLVEVQRFMGQGDERAERIYQTIGVYLGYAVAQYAEFYDFRHLLTLGRVTTGKGGSVILSHARRVLDQEFPELSSRIAFHTPDEKEKRHGQAIAAASLPMAK
ncbi:MAG TPA: ROK family protein [Verrucomicrobiae bacterium]|nr:ROK family protein [Verrucomicrobiae bacterium]